MINHSAVIRKEKAIMQNITLSSMNDGKNNYEKVFSVIGTKGIAYDVTIKNKPECTCPDNANRLNRCKHIYYILLRVLDCDNEDTFYYTNKQLYEMFGISETPVDNKDIQITDIDNKREFTLVNGKHIDNKDTQTSNNFIFTIPDKFCGHSNKPEVISTQPNDDSIFETEIVTPKDVSIFETEIVTPKDINPNETIDIKPIQLINDVKNENKLPKNIIPIYENNYKIGYRVTNFTYSNGTIEDDMDFTSSMVDHYNLKNAEGYLEILKVKELIDKQTIQSIPPIETITNHIQLVDGLDSKIDNIDNIDNIDAQTISQDIQIVDHPSLIDSTLDKLIEELSIAVCVPIQKQPLKIIFENTITNRFKHMEYDTDMITTITKYIEENYNIDLRNIVDNASIGNEIWVNTIMGDNSFSGPYIKQINEDLYELHMKTIDKTNTGWIFNNFTTETNSQKIGRFIRVLE